MTEPKHEPKTCPRCSQPFICKPGDIANCQCSTVEISNEMRAALAAKYSDCLCVNCLRELAADAEVENYCRD